MNQTVARIVHDLFGVPPDECSDSLSPETVKGWDSVSHLTLVMALEQAFHVEFSPEEMAELVSVGKIKEILGKHGVRRAET